MEKKEFIIIPEFTTIEDGLKYIVNNDIKFSFSVNNETYSSNGIKINTPNNSEIININNIFIGVYYNAGPGQLYIENDFLKYYKEN